MNIKDTFSATGQSTSINKRYISAALVFAGTASVSLEVEMPDGTWLAVGDAITASGFQNIDNPTHRNYRLNCTDYTDDVVYELVGVEG